MIYQLRKRTKPEDIIYSLHLYFSGLSLRNTSKALSKFAKRSHTTIKDWIQKYKPKRLFYKETKIAEGSVKLRVLNYIFNQMNLVLYLLYK